MNTEVKIKWVAALRSGEYKQGKRKLHGEGNFFCCLGVLCDIYQKQHPETSKWEGGRFFADQSDSGSSTSQFYLPMPVRAWAGLKSSNPITISERGVESSMSDYNDHYHYSFNMIGDVIEKNL